MIMLADALLDDPASAFCRDNHVALRGSGAGPLAGLAMGVKDLFHVAGHRTGFGNPDWLATHPPAPETAAAVQMLLDAGADMIGKTHTDELAYSLSGENVHYGTPLNTCCPDRVPGGSSCGSVAAVAAELVDFALGSDCGGSVRLPASYCGVLGMRPTLGRIPMEGAVPFAASFDVVGWFARDARIFERVGAVLLGDDAVPARLRRLLIVDDAFSLVEERVAGALRTAVRHVASSIEQFKNITLSPDGLADWMNVFRTVQGSEIWANHGEWIRRTKPRIGKPIRERLDWAAKLTPEAVAAAKGQHASVIARLDALIDEGDVLVLPTSPRIAPVKGTEHHALEITYRYQAMCLLCVSGLGGLPQISLPLATLDGCPLGLSIISRRGSDRALLALGRQIMETTR
jgi:amidase